MALRASLTRKRPEKSAFAAPPQVGEERRRAALVPAPPPQETAVRTAQPQTPATIAAPLRARGAGRWRRLAPPESSPSSRHGPAEEGGREESRADLERPGFCVSLLVLVVPLSA